MADHPAIVALATSQYDRNPEYDDDMRMLSWEELEPEQRAWRIEGAALVYAFVLKDLKRRAVEGEGHKFGLIVYPPPGTERWLDERAREIGVEI